MKQSLRHIAVLAAATLVLAACNKPAEKAEATATAGAESTEATSAATKIPGLEGEKAQSGYVIGLDIAKSLEPAKGEYDIDAMIKGLKAGVAGEKALIDDKQAQVIREAFGQKIQAKRIAEMMAKAKKNAEAGTAFLAENGKKEGVKTTASGLQYQVITEGTGAKPKATDVVKVHYKGTLLDGKTFDSSYDRGEPVVFPLQGVVPGWQEGLQLMTVGSKYKFWIPAKLGYGEAGTPGGPIGPNETLVFEVELQDVVQPSKK